MRRSQLPLVGLTALMLLVAGCSGSDSLATFCELHTDPELEGLDPSDPQEAKKLSAGLASMVESAPDEIRDDVETTRDGFEAARTGDVENLDVEEFQAASKRVEEYAEDKCR